MDEDLNKIFEKCENEKRIDNMFFGEGKNKVTLENIYDEAKIILPNKEKIFNWSKYYYIKLSKSEDDIFLNLEIINNQRKVFASIELFGSPIRLNLSEESYIDIVNQKQFKKISNEFPKHKLYCTNEQENISFDIYNILMHQKCNTKILLINESDDINIQEQEFRNKFKEFPKSKIFQSPYEFDIHYSHYFEFDKYYKYESKFEYFIDYTGYRSILSTYLKLLSLNKLYILFGKSGIGKSITIIQVFKYLFDHKKKGTLYINCKSIYENFKKNINISKKILIDEIAFLFEDEYKEFIKCANKINKYIPNKDSTFWDLIHEIIAFCKNSKKNYYIIFDQYKNKIDEKGELFKLNEKLKKTNQFCIIACCSLNDKDIRFYKITKLFNPKEAQEKLPDNLEIKEVTHLLDNSNFWVDNGGIFDDAFKKLGKNVKNYMALSEIKKLFPYKLDTFMQEKKKKIQDNLLDFYKVDNFGKNNISSIYNLFKFSVETEYEITYLYQIQDSIPFKYFDIIKTKNELDGQYAKIVYNFELVKEAINDIYDSLIYENPSIYSIFNNNILLDEGALGGIFEKYVIHHMLPDESLNRKNLFGIFSVNKEYIVKKFIPNDNEILEVFNKYNRKNLNPGTYLFKQKNFNGKGFDAAIIMINKKDEAIAYLFQISINKKEIYTKNQLKDFINLFIQYFQTQFTFKLSKDKVFFTYIFDIKNKKDLLKKCKEASMKCIFFRPSIKMFTNENGQNLENIKNIEDIFVCPFNDNYNKDIEMNDIKDCKQVFLNNNQLNNLLLFLKSIFSKNKNNEINIIFSNKMDFFDESFLNEERILLRNIEKEELRKWKDCVKGGRNKFKKLVEEEKEDDKEEEKEDNKEEEEEDEEEDEKKKCNKFKLLILKKRNIKFYLIFPKGEIIDLKKIPIENDNDKKNIYDVFYIENL